MGLFLLLHHGKKKLKSRAASIMNILLIDNGTILLPNLKKLFKEHNVQIYSWDKIEQKSTKNSDLIVLTGSSKYSVLEDEYVYKQQALLLKDTDKPIVGICAGFELIVHSFGGELTRKRKKIAGLRKLEILQDDVIFTGLENTTVREAHHYRAIDLPSSLIPLAKSTYGYEIIKHKNRFIYGFQFHPELETKEKTGEILMNNLLEMIS